MMPTRRPVPTSTALVGFAAVAIVIAACSTSSPGGSSHFTTPVAHAPETTTVSSPTATPTPPTPVASTSAVSRPPAIAGAFGVLAGPFTGTNYNVTLVGIDGKVAASSQAAAPQFQTCAGNAAGVVPYPLSASNTAVYFMDATGAVRWLSPTGSTSASPVITLPVGPSTRSVFAVSPDDSRIAVAVIDFVSGGASTRLFVDDLSVGGAHNQIFSESGPATVWPIGWHAGYLVVAKVTACTGSPGCCSYQEYHVVDPATALRKYTVGGSGCMLVGAPTPAGTLCENSTYTLATQLDWTGAPHAHYPISSPQTAILSPGGSRVAFVSNIGTSVVGSNVKWANLFACVWIDESHVLSNGGVNGQPAVGEFPSGVKFPVSAVGDCAGRIPGGL